MHRSHRFIASLFLAAALVAPVAIVAAAAPQTAVQIRVYDRDHHVYHNWDDREDRAYRGYLTEQRISYREYNRQNHRRQRAYWNWRYSHPDRD